MFPHYVNLWGKQIHPHLLFESLGYAVAFGVYLVLRRRFGDNVTAPTRWVVVAGAVAGGAIGAKLLFLFEDPQLTMRNLQNPAYLTGGKTIVGALAFGLLFVELLKNYIRLSRSTGDLYAIPLCLGIAVGRIGCFLTGLGDNTYGKRTSLPWAVDFGDGVPRHPTQLYETLFLVAFIPILYFVLLSISKRKDRSVRTVFVDGDAFKLFMVAYMTFRLLCDFIKPYPRIFLGLGGIQWACLLVLLYYSRDVARWLRLAGVSRRLSLRQA
ncbi:MAG TPA: prolipoprotein diacylglyceryl transferase family protein [Terriglobales bacterium]|nr:prolipoprotein diacylglyceryl transferase family protein [Terriglobales bacterium]